jgi:RNA polymerase sigma-70 factor (ECF subfamily)
VDWYPALQPPPTGENRVDLDLEIATLHADCCEELVRYALSIVRNHDSARDAVQEAFLRYFVERKYGRTVVYPRAWLYRVVRNLLLDRMDKAAARQESAQENAADLADGTHGPEEMLRCAELADQLTSMLSPREMECLSLRADGLSYDEIGEVLSIRSGTVSSLLSRVHKKLREARTRQDGRPGLIDGLSLLIRAGGAYSS